jgi:hypothetical protein
VNPHDPFEARLRRQPLRGVPTDWREEILAAAAANRGAEPGRELALLAAVRLWLRELLWPAPQAWAGLAAVWLVLLAVNLTTREPASANLARFAAPATPVRRELLSEQHQLFAELVGPPEPRPADRPKPPASQPRSQRREEFFQG